MPAVTTENEFQHGLRSLEKEAAPGARLFVKGAGRHGDFTPD